MTAARALPAPARCERCAHETRPVRVSFHDEPVACYADACVNPRCGYVPMPAPRTIPDRVWARLQVAEAKRAPYDDAAPGPGPAR